MPQRRANGPYIWATWLARLLTGENSCEWAGWFKAQHESWSCTKAPSNFNQSQWMLRHTDLLNRERGRWEEQGYAVYTEGQNSFALRGNAAVIAGKPDLVAVKDSAAVIIDAKTGRPKASDAIQVALYMYALPRALARYRGFQFTGQVAYPDNDVEVPAGAVDQTFVQSLGALVRRLASETPAVRVPTPGECRFCDITAADCPERMESSEPEEGTTEDF